MQQLLVLIVVLIGSVQSVNITKLSATSRKFNFHLRARIVGGRQTTIEDFPYQVSIVHDRSHTCGGSIYKPDIIITAAHCLVDIEMHDLAVVAGTTDWEGGGVETSIRKFVMHPKFDPKTFDYDIAILKLTDKLQYGPRIQPITLPVYRQEFKPGSVGVVSGWGALGEDGDDPDELHFTSLKIVSNNECYKAYRDINPVTKNMMCAWIRKGGHGTCQGDSGSALVVGNVLAGIVSWGLGCARPNVPEVYTKVSTFRRWLDLNIKSLNN